MESLLLIVCAVLSYTAAVPSSRLQHEAETGWSYLPQLSSLNHSLCFSKKIIICECNNHILYSGQRWEDADNEITQLCGHVCTSD